MKKPGDRLRDQIAQLLRMKFQHVEIEKRLETTTADIFFVDDTNPIFQRSIAVEAKDWKSSLTSEDIAGIYNLYAPSLSAKSIDYLWIVGQQPLAGSPRQSLDKLGGVRYSTFDEFRASLMNFTGLLNNNIHLFDHSDPAKYFVPTRVRHTGQQLSEYVQNWLGSEHTGLLVYGGYGLGKTTFSMHLASALSKKYLNGDFDRIPIRIALGGMYSKQDLTALICSALSGGDASAAVKDFSYGLFLEMNHQGQYLLILDGFDEMRHAMDLDDFVYTFEDMKPLFSGSAKIIILGRPDSFLTTYEEDQVLASLLDSSGEQSKRLTKVEVAFFSKNEVESYLSNFIAQRPEPFTDRQQETFSSLMAKLPDSEDNILSRPVQLKMFTKIIDECLVGEIVLNRYELYKKFIYNFIARESQKAARQRSGPISGFADLKDDRAKFMQAMAWWVLNGKKENRFLAEEIPLNIIPDKIRSGRNTSTAVREALVGSVIEPISQAGVLGSKARKYYFFPHKSYLEFLVANYFDTYEFSTQVYREFMSNVNNEILTFLEEGPPTGVHNLRTGLTHNLGVIDPRIIEVCATDCEVPKEVESQKRSNRIPSHIYTHYFYLRKRGSGAASYLTRRLRDSSVTDSALANITCIANELATIKNSPLARALILNCLTNVPAIAFRDYSKTGKTLEVYRRDIDGLNAAVLAQCITCSKSIFVIDVEKLQQLVQSGSRGTMFVHIPVNGPRITKVEVRADKILSEISGSLAQYIESVVESCAGLTAVIEVRLFGDAERFSTVTLEART